MTAEQALKLYVGDRIKNVQVFESFKDVPKVILILFESNKMLRIESTTVTNSSSDGVEYIPSFKLTI